MLADVVTRGEGAFEISKIVWQQPNRSNGTTIKLGFLCELATSEMRVLGLIARTDLNEFELELVGELGRRILYNPFDYLNEWFHQAWKEASPGHAIRHLLKDHRHSITLERPETHILPKDMSTDGSIARSKILLFLDERLEEASEGLRPLTIREIASPIGVPRTAVALSAA